MKKNIAPKELMVDDVIYTIKSVDVHEAINVKGYDAVPGVILGVEVDSKKPDGLNVKVLWDQEKEISIVNFTNRYSYLPKEAEGQVILTETRALEAVQNMNNKSLDIVKAAFNTVESLAEMWNKRASIAPNMAQSGRDIIIENNDTTDMNMKKGDETVIKITKDDED